MNVDECHVLKTEPFYYKTNDIADWLMLDETGCKLPVKPELQQRQQRFNSALIVADFKKHIMSCKTYCNYCSRKFVSKRSLVKHCTERHGKSVCSHPRFFDSKNEEILNIPDACAIESESVHNNYLRWLACVVERVNGSHHPKCEGQYKKKNASTVYNTT